MHPDFETKIGGKKCVLYTHVYGINISVICNNVLCRHVATVLKANGSLHSNDRKL